MSNTTFKRILAGLLCGLMLGTSLVACASDDGKTSVGTTASGTDTAAPSDDVNTEPVETEPTSALEPIDLEQKEISFITRAPYSYCYPYHELLAEETTGDALNDAIYKRNLIVEERYKCQLLMNAVENSDIQNLVNQDILSNNGEYDIIQGSISNNITWAQKQYLIEMHEFDDIIQFDQPWWMRHILEATSLSGKNFFCPSDTNIAAFHAIGITYFNKAFVEEYKIENLYDLVREGKWTFDKMNELCAGMYRDLNGNQAVDAEDAFGMILNSYSWQPLFYGGGNMMVIKDADDAPSLAASTETNLNYLEKIIAFANSTDYVFNSHTYSGYGGEQNAAKFRDQQSLFYIEAAYSLPNLRSMEVDFGVLPMPKADEAQEYYISSIHTGHSSAMSVPITNEDYDTTARILEDMAFYSYHYVRPVFVEQMVKTRLSRDADSSEMFDYIYEHVVLDLVLVFSSKIGIDGDVRDCIKNGGGFITSTLASNQKVYSTLLDRCVKAVLEGS